MHIVQHNYYAATYDAEFRACAFVASLNIIIKIVIRIIIISF